jgi:PhnB protein
MTPSPVPEGFHTITPNIIVEDGPSAIAFLCQALGAEEIVRLTLPDGKIVHAELKIGDSRLNVGESMDGWPAHGLVAQVHVANSDELFARAVAAGATVVMPMTDMFFGSREGRVRDPFGNIWTIATRTEIVSYAEMQRRLDEQAGA